MDRMMQRAVARLADRLAPGWRDPRDVRARSRLGSFEGWTAIAVNVILAAAKAGLGLFTGSLALYADAIHTLADSATSLVVIIAFRLARRPPDPEHPFGHGRVENIAGVVMAVLLAVTAWETGRSAVERMARPRAVEVNLPVLGAVLLLLLVKEILARFAIALGRLLESEALVADGWHHRSDALSTALVLVSFLAGPLGAPWLDGAAGLGVALLIAYAAYHTLVHSSGPLLGQGASPQMVADIARLARSVEGVRGVHDILAHRYGSATLVTLHVEVDPGLTAEEAHRMADAVEKELDRRYPGRSTVHVDPLSHDHPHFEEVQAIVRDTVAERGDCFDFHDLRLLGAGERFKIVFELTPRGGPDEEARAECRALLETRLRARFPLADVRVAFDPMYHRPDPGPGA